MKKLILMLLLTISAAASAQKMTIKTGNGQTVEISCEGNLKPQAISVASDGTVTLKMGEETTPVTSANVAEADSYVETTDSLETENPVFYTGEELETDVKSDSLASDSLSTSAAIAAVANAVVEELSPEYAQFNKEHEGTHPGTEKELVKRIAKNYVDEDIVEAADLLTQLFGSIRFTKDSTFVPKYAMRKAKPEWRAYDIVELSGNLGKDISSVSDDMATRITEKDYGDDTENEKKYGGGIKYSRTYMRGTIEDGEWKPNPLGFAVSWGGLFSYAYEQDAGSFVNAMGKVGVQIGHDICFGVDALCGVGIVPYKTFITNDINHNTVSKSAWCFKYGVEGWGSLNFSKDTYTAIYGRYITSIRPATGKYELSKGWNVLYEDFDPSCWEVGLAVGYKFGAPEPLKQEKRLRANISTGYNFTGNKGIFVATEIERFSQVSKSTYLSYGLRVEDAFGSKEKGGDMTSFLLSGGFQVCQPYNCWFWGTKLLGGVGEYPVVNIAKQDKYTVKDYATQLCFRTALQLSGGIQLGKGNTIYCGVRVGGHFGKSITFENFEDGTKVENLSGFDLGASLGYNFTF